MAKLIELKEAAALLGITPDELTELRSRSKIFGYRDGSTWKFKESELERYAEQQGIVLGGAEPALDEPPKPPRTGHSVPAVDADLDELVDVNLEDDVDSILVSEKELGSGPGASSTIIGKEEHPEDVAGDLKLSPTGAGDTQDSALRLAEEGSELKLAGDSELNLDIDSGSAPSDDLDLTLGSDSLDGSELQLAGDSQVKPSGSGGDLGGLTGAGASDFDLNFEDSGSELRLSGDSALQEPSHADLLSGELQEGSGGTGDLLGGSDDDLILDASGTAHGDLALDRGDDDLVLESSDNISGLNLDGSGIDLDIASGTEAGLIMDDSGSDVTLNAGDSGINLAKPSESGISLESDALELGGSGVDALELGEADIVDLDDAEIDFEAATQLKADDDFLLSPVEGALGDDIDSGSQVIALDNEELGDDDSLLGRAAPVMEVDEEFGAAPAATTGVALAPTAPTAATASTAAGEPAEAPYSIWNVLGLFGCLFLLMLTGIMMIDLLRNMWSWNQPFSINSKLMDFIISLFGR